MGMGYGSNFADVISEGALEKIVPNEYNALMDALEPFEMDMDDFAPIACERSEFDEETVSEEEQEQIMALFEKMREAFAKETGLELYLDYHSCDDEGDRYDDVDGHYFYVDGMYQLSPEGKALQDRLGTGLKVERKFFVTFG